MPKTNVHAGYRGHKKAGVHAGRKRGGVTIFTKHDHADKPIMAKGRSGKAR